MEIISPGGFEHYFEDVIERPETGPTWPSRYGIEMDVPATFKVRDQFELVFPVPLEASS